MLASPSARGCLKCAACVLISVCIYHAAILMLSTEGVLHSTVVSEPRRGPSEALGSPGTSGTSGPSGVDPPLLPGPPQSRALPRTSGVPGSGASPGLSAPLTAGGSAAESEGELTRQGPQEVHWIFTTDCTAYMFTQGNLLLASALHVGLPGRLTWIMAGCRTEAERAETAKLLHPRATVWHAPRVQLVHPVTGEPYGKFQASNRPASIAAWWQAVKPQEEAIGILDPDEYWLRAVHLVNSPKRSTRGPWSTTAVRPRKAVSAFYSIGCVPLKLGWSKDFMASLCREDLGACMRAIEDKRKCRQSYSNGPPWILHRADAENVFRVWTNASILINSVWKSIFAEQASYGVAQMQFGVRSDNDGFWFLSMTGGEQEQLWKDIEETYVRYDPCRERLPPPPDVGNLPPLLHTCITLEMPHLQNQGFRLHKDHVHKDILDCDAPLIHYPPRDALKHYVTNGSIGRANKGFRTAWMICTWTNIINTFATQWKTRFCAAPNLSASFKYPAHCAGWARPESRLRNIFRQGGWCDRTHGE